LGLGNEGGLAVATHLAPVEYEQLIGAIREVVHRVVPLNATVMVVSRGDDELTRLGPRTALHFPQDEDGRYAGYHPSDSDAAIAAYEKSLADARASAQALAAKTHQELAAKSEARRKELEAGLAAKLADAEKKIEATKTGAMKNVGAIATDAAASIVERLTGSAPDKAVVERAVSATIN